mmetsp:Transcript_13113/g.24644  ORF Transcript_13113/g.24644 Transcript_13113/m.24644 type:complete len:91 (+) Transcript_13113:119-391(+)
MNCLFMKWTLFRRKNVISGLYKHFCVITVHRSHAASRNLFDFVSVSLSVSVELMSYMMNACRVTPHSCGCMRKGKIKLTDSVKLWYRSYL